LCSPCSIGAKQGNGFRSVPGGRDADDKPQETFLAGRYVDRFERHNDEWRMAHRTVVYNWIRQRLLPADFAPEMFRTH
jgi:hypothetical protein